MLDYTKKTVANNEQNVKDSEAGAPGANPLTDVRASLPHLRSIKAYAT